MMRYLLASTVLMLSCAYGQAQEGSTKQYKISELPRPLGIYALIEGHESLETVGNIGENICLMQPVVFPGRGQIWLKQLGAPIDGNPYQFKSWMECSKWDGEPENCVMHQGAPDMPNPVGAQGGMDYSPIGDGHFKACLSDKESCSLLYACVSPDGELTVDRQLTNGTNVIEAILAYPNGEPSAPKYIDNETIQYGR